MVLRAARREQLCRDGTCNDSPRHNKKRNASLSSKWPCLFRARKLAPASGGGSDAAHTRLLRPKLAQIVRAEIQCRAAAASFSPIFLYTCARWAPKPVLVTLVDYYFLPPFDCKHTKRIHARRKTRLAPLFNGRAKEPNGLLRPCQADSRPTGSASLQRRSTSARSNAKRCFCCKRRQL